jgi:hypothetical protein
MAQVYRMGNSDGKYTIDVSCDGDNQIASQQKAPALCRGMVFGTADVSDDGANVCGLWESVHTTGLTFWLWRNRLVGSYLFFKATSCS